MLEISGGIAISCSCEQKGCRTENGKMGELWMVRNLRAGRTKSVYLAICQSQLYLKSEKKTTIIYVLPLQYIGGQEELRVIKLVQSNLDYWKWMKLNSTFYRVIYWETKVINIENKIIVNFWTKLPYRYNVLSHQSLNALCIRKLKYQSLNRGLTSLAFIHSALAESESQEQQIKSPTFKNTSSNLKPTTRWNLGFQFVN